jgi:hypothetical protein
MGADLLKKHRNALPSGGVRAVRLESFCVAGLKMTLAAILAFCLLSSGATLPRVREVVPEFRRQPAMPAALRASSQAGTPQTQPVAPSPAQPATSRPTSAAKPRHRKKKTTPNCTTAGNAPNLPENSAASSPCPPPKKVVRNGGSDEPTVELKGGTPTQQAWQQSSTEQLRAATEENLKKIADRSLDPSRQEMANQVKQFLEQSKAAVAAGDLDRGHSLALKAHLLSDELVKP